MNPEDHKKDLAKLNDKQRSIFETVVSRIQHQMKHETTVAFENDIEIKECSCDQNPPPLRMFVSGVGGTGKSFLIRCIKNELILLCMNRLFPKDDEPKHEFVVVLAPTGVAAFNINGETIHGFYKLPVQKRKER